MKRLTLLLALLFALALPARIQAAINGRVTLGGAGFSGTTVTAQTAPVSTTTPLPIADFSTVDMPLVIGNAETIGAVRVGVNITHTFRGDLEITLIHPDGTQVRLKNSDSDSSDNVVTSYPDLTLPVQDLAPLAGKPANGAWILRVRDAAAQDVGQIDSFTLTFTLPAATTDANGNYTIPASSAQNFTVQPVRAGCTFTPASRTVASNASGVDFAGAGAISGRVISGSLGVPNLVMVARTAPVRNTTPQNLPDTSTTNVPLTIAGAGTIGAVRVEVEIEHTFRGDLELTLIHPDGTLVRLKDTDLNDDGQNVIATYPDTVAPAQSLAVLAGKPINGAWTLRVRDAFAGDTGRVVAFGLTFSLPAVTTNTSGDYTIPIGSVQNFTVQPERAGFVFTPASRVVATAGTGVDFAVASGAITGRITANGAGLAGVAVSAGAFSAVTDANGDFIILGIAPGTYAVTASLPGYGFAGGTTSSGLGDAVNFTTSTYPIAGRIVDGSGAGVPGVIVSANGGFSATTDASGHYLIALVPPGGRTVAPAKNGFVFTPAGINVAMPPAATAVNFTATSTPPTISNLPDVVIAKGTNTGPLRFDVNDVESRAGLLTVAATSSDSQLVPASGIELGGVGVSRSVTITPDPTRTGTATITVTVTDESGLTASDTFLLRVNAAPLAGVGRALTFDGVDDGVLVSSNVLDFKGNYTIECWVNAPASSTGTIVAQGTGGGFVGLAVTVAGRVQVGTWDTGVAFPFGAWHHLAVVKETANARLYIDGALVASRGSTLPLATQNARFDIGRRLSGDFWLGSIDELRVWGVARTGTQIADARAVRVLGSEPELRGLWRFDEATGATAADATPAARHGTITGAARIQADVIFPRYAIAKYTSFTDSLHAFDADADALTFAIVTPPVRGTLTLTDPATGAFSYVPNAGAEGADPFTFSVSDGVATSDIALVTIDIAPDVTPPTIAALAPVTTPEDTSTAALAVTIGDAERPAAQLTLTAASSNVELIPLSGIVFGGTGANRTVTLTPAPNANGTADITVTVSDGVNTASRTFLATVTAVDDLPTIVGPFTNQIARRGVPTVPQTFTISDVDTPIGNLVVTAGANNTTIVPTVTIGGTGANRTVSVTGSASVSGATTVVVEVSDGRPQTAFLSFSVSVVAEPTIAPIADQTAFSDITTRDIEITLADLDSFPATLTLTATSSDPALVPASGFTINGTFGQRFLYIRPAAKAEGVATITLTVSDGSVSTTQSFQLTVIARPEFDFIELPLPTPTARCFPEALNDAGQIIGNSNSGTWTRPLLWDANGTTPTVTVLRDGANITLFAINKAGAIASIVNGRAAVYRGGTFTNYGVTGVGSTADDINDSGLIIGRTFNPNGHFLHDGTTQTDLAPIFDSSGASFVRMNERADVFGVSPSRTNAILSVITNPVNGTRTARDLGNFGGPGFLATAGINNSGQVAATVNSTDLSNRSAVIFNYKTNTLTNLGNPLSAVLLGPSVANGINDAGEVVGLVGGGSNAIPFIYSEGRAFNLQTLVDTGGMTLIDAAAINSVGDIVGYGQRLLIGDAPLPFLLRRKPVDVGQPLAPPAAAVNTTTNLVFHPPAFEALDGTPPEEAAQAFLWSPVDQRAYLLRPIRGRITWYTSTDRTDPDQQRVRGISAVWPANPQIHIAGAPVQLDPLDIAFPYRAVAKTYSTVLSSTFDVTSKTLQVPTPGYTVIRYLIAPGSPLGTSPDVTTQRNYFQVVRSVAWNDPAFLLDGQPATVGTKVTDPRGITNSPKTGWTVFERGPYDGVGADRAYDRATQTGPIIPVNKDTTAADDDLAVAYYQRNARTGAFWPDKPVRYIVSWPGPGLSFSLVIANPEGSGPLSAAQFPGKHIYHQPVPTLAGYNPNEEHALFAPVGTGEALFALRNDLNRDTTSQPFVLLKYRDPATNEWRIRLYSVQLTDPTHQFLFFANAGQELSVPYPLNRLILCRDLNTVASGAAYKDYNGKFYAQAGPGAGAINPNVVINYGYKLQPGFFQDTNGDRVNDAIEGACIPWNSTGTTAGSSEPIDVTYRIRWPQDTPTLQLGETLLTSKRDLPSITNFANAQIAFDSLNPTGTAPLSTSARLYDPLSARTLRVITVPATPTTPELPGVPGIPANYQFPSEVRLQNVAGKQVFSDLPFVLRSRLSFDPINKTLTFAGFLDSSVVGEPLLLTNVLSSRERDRIKALSSEAKFQSIIDALYDFTRNPNGVNLTTPGSLPPTKDLLIGYTTKYVTADGTFFGTKPPGTITSATIVQEPLGALPKALTAGLPPSALNASFGNALSFSGAADAGLTIGQSYNIGLQPTLPVTVTAWFKFPAGYTGGGTLIRADGAYRIRTSNGRLQASYPHVASQVQDIESAPVNDGQWHHVAFVVNATGGTLYVDGVSQGARSWTSGPPVLINTGLRFIGVGLNATLDEVAIWNVAQTPAQINANRTRELFGNEPGLLSYWRFNETAGNIVLDGATGNDGQFEGTGITRVPSTLSIPAGTEAPRYVVIAENNDPNLNLPVTLHTIQVGGALFRGDVKIIFPDNVFDERLTLRHSSDFGGDPDRLTFEWWYHPDTAEFVPTALPITDAAGNVTNTNGWIQYRPPTTGLNSVTIGDGGDSSLFVLQDNWFIVRYRGYALNGQTNWGPWVGDPASTTLTRAAFAPGWIKRVIEGINPFEQRVKDFHSNAVNTYSSMLVQAGQRYEGPIALNPSSANLNSVGLIETYSTVLDRGKSLSIDSPQGVDSDPANNALLLAASRISDLYMLLGNEAYADAQDPTIGYDTSGQFGTAAPSIFAFQNQLDSLLEEELTLLRGRDDGAAGVGARPVYNRLLWNFTGSDGEVAYSQTYNISDQTRDGTINEFDARIMFPQGHGDAWGHYLTALTNYYDLLRHPNFTWIPRPETTLIAGTAVRVDFLDERKFAKAAVAKARAGAQIVDLTYRLNYVDDPNGQYQGYKDTNTDRAWGVSEWARRAGQGAYFDWLAANAILPSTDPNLAHTGIQKVDRQTVSELDELIGQHSELLAQIDKADAGLNPLGVAAGAIPFDINPALVVSGTPQTHFDQINSRAVAAVTNAVSLFNFANQLNQILRRNQDTQDSLATNTIEKERDLKNRMIELYGYPYAGDIGPAGTYLTGYDGPDLYHYMYVNPSELTGTPGVPSTSITGFYKGLQTNGAVTPVESKRAFPADVPNPAVLDVPAGGTFTVTFPFSTGSYGLVAPASWGTRRASGKLQINLSDLLRAEAKLKQAIVKYDLLLKQINDTTDILEAQYNLNTDKIVIKTTELGLATTALTTRVIAKQTSLLSKRIALLVQETGKMTSDTIPKTIGLAVDAFAPVRGAITGISIGAKEALNVAADQADFAEFTIKETYDVSKLATGLSLEVETQKYEVIQKVKALEQLVRTEVQVRYELFELKEALAQAMENYRTTLAQAERIGQERLAFRRNVAATTQQARYTDMAFRIFQNDALQKYRAQFDLAARYVYLAAKAYDYETCLLGTGSGVGQRFLTDIVKQRSLGQVVGGFPVSGSVGLADPLARLGQNFEVYRGQLGFNNPETETGRFSLRKERFRIAKPTGTATNPESLRAWKNLLRSSIVPDLWQVPEFRKYCRPFAPESAGPQPGLVIPFSTTVTFGLNYFGWPLGGGDNAYDPSRFATKVRSAGVNFESYNGSGLSNTPRVYLVPVGDDFLRSPSGDGQQLRTFSVVDQKLPVPFPIGPSDLNNPAWIPDNDTLNEDFGGIRQYSSFRAYHDSGTFTAAEQVQDSRLIGRSVWNTKWLLIIPGGTFLNDPDQGLETFINSNTDIRIFFQTYSYSGN